MAANLFTPDDDVAPVTDGDGGIGRMPAGRRCETADPAGTCVSPPSAASNIVTGACIPVDGGYAASDGLDRG